MLITCIFHRLGHLPLFAHQVLKNNQLLCTITVLQTVYHDTSAGCLSSSPCSTGIRPSGWRTFIAHTTLTSALLLCSTSCVSSEFIWFSSHSHVVLPDSGSLKHEGWVMSHFRVTHDLEPCLDLWLIYILCVAALVCTSYGTLCDQHCHTRNTWFLFPSCYLAGHSLNYYHPGYGPAWSKPDWLARLPPWRYPLLRPLREAYCNSALWATPSISNDIAWWNSVNHNVP